MFGRRPTEGGQSSEIISENGQNNKAQITEEGGQEHESFWGEGSSIKKEATPYPGNIERRVETITAEAQSEKTGIDTVDNVRPIEDNQSAEVIQSGGNQGGSSEDAREAEVLKAMQYKYKGKGNPLSVDYANEIENLLK